MASALAPRAALDLSYLGIMTDFWPGTTVTSFHNGQCYGNVTLCINSDILCNLSVCDVSLAQVEYIPSIAGNGLYIAIFAICLALQIYFGIRYRTWGYMIATISGFALEIIGYAGRVMLWQNPFDHNAFLIYLVCLTIGPAFLSASIYLCLARIVIVYGEGLSRFYPRTYTLLFCTCDFIALLLQAVGGAIASTASDHNTAQQGINIMIGGLSFQVASLVLFMLACVDYALRLWRSPDSWNMSYASLRTSKLFQGFLFSLGVATFTIFVRSCFRVAELSGGFNGTLANSEITFMILEGAMIVIASLCLTAFHPGVCFKGVWAQCNFRMRAGKATKGGSGDESDSVKEATQIA